MFVLSSIALMGALLTAQAALVDEDLKLEVRRLVRQLDADVLADRDAAEEALVARGPAVLDLLPEPSERMSAEARQRIGRIQQRLQRAAAEAAARASTITLRSDAIRLSEALKALQEQSGNPIVDYRPRFGQEATNPTLKLAIDKAPFWQALDEVLDQAGLAVYAYGEDRGVHVVARTPGQSRSAHVCYSGPFRFEAIGVKAERNLRAPEADSLTLEVEAAWEPRLRPISLRQRIEDLGAVDEAGNVLAAADRKAAIESLAIGESAAMKLALPFKLPPRGTQQIASLKGTLQAILPGKVESFRFGELAAAKNVEKRIAGVTVTLEGVRKNADLWQVRMRVKFDEAGEALATHRGWVFKNEAFLEGPDGKPIPYDVFETTRQSSNEVGIAYGFVLDGPPEGMTFVYKTPGVLIATEFEYELTRIKLP